MSSSLTMNPDLSFKKQISIDTEEPLDKDWLRLSTSTDSCYQQPPPQKSQPSPPPPESPLPLTTLLQLMTPSSSLPPEPPGFPFLLPMCSSSLQLHQDGIFPPQQPHPQPPEPPVHHFSPSHQPHKPELPRSDSLQLQPVPPEQQPQPPDSTQTPEQTSSPEGQGRRGRRPYGTSRSRKRQKQGKEETIEPPYPWATSRRAKILSMEELLSNNITVISGEVHCKQCKKQYVIEYNLRSKFREVASFIAERIESMKDRAPEEWFHPKDFHPKELECKFCGNQKCEPLITKKRSINWLFLFLGQMIGFCSLSHLKYYCKHCKIHRTGAKDRLLYSVYMDLRQKLYPDI